MVADKARQKAGEQAAFDLFSAADTLEANAVPSQGWQLKMIIGLHQWR